MLGEHVERKEKVNGGVLGASQSVKSSRVNIGAFVVRHKTPNPRDWQLLTLVEIYVRALEFADTLARYLAIPGHVLHARSLSKILVTAARILSRLYAPVLTLRVVVEAFSLPTGLAAISAGKHCLVKITSARTFAMTANATRAP